MSKRRSKARTPRQAPSVSKPVSVRPIVVSSVKVPVLTRKVDVYTRNESAYLYALVAVIVVGCTAFITHHLNYWSF
jgi:hypothetical protein